MATVPTPATQVAGLVVAAATINGQGNLATYLAGRTESGGARRPLCKMRQTVAQSFANGVAAPVTFDAEDVDYDNGHSTVTNTSRYTAATAGWHVVIYAYAFAGNATSDRGCFLRLNGATNVNGSRVTTPAAPATDPSCGSGSILLFLNATDYVELMAFQNSGIAINTSVGGADQSMMCVEWRSV